MRDLWRAAQGGDDIFGRETEIAGSGEGERDVAALMLAEEWRLQLIRAAAPRDIGDDPVRLLAQGADDEIGICLRADRDDPVTMRIDILSRPIELQCVGRDDRGAVIGVRRLGQLELRARYRV